MKAKIFILGDVKSSLGSYSDDKMKSEGQIDVLLRSPVRPERLLYD